MDMELVMDFLKLTFTSLFSVIFLFSMNKRVCSWREKMHLIILKNNILPCGLNSSYFIGQEYFTVGPSIWIFFIKNS